MTTRSTDSSQGDGGVPSAPPGLSDQQRSRAGNMVFKSGPLFVSSKGIGWTSWKKRWFILTRTSLVFFRSDPSAIPQKGSEVNLTLGGIDLNNSGSVVVKEDKKLLTVLFPDGRDGRGFTLKAETLEDLHEWKAALEKALTQAPSAAIVVGQNGIFRNGQAEAAEGSLEQTIDKQTVKSTVIGRPILLALEDIDGTPSFLEKALRFIEEHGVKIEGILRQAADVDDVERRVREYEQGKVEFSPEEDSHVIADCVKHVLRELPSSPVPASCCNALLEACRTDRSVRINAMRSAICETFPEPNRRLLQRILTMMQTVASHKAENRMSSSAVAACMAPLLLRPLLAGDCELENDFDVGGDGSVQLLQAAAAANHAQAIVITLLEEYDNIFGEGSISPNLYSDSEESGSGSDGLTDDDDESYEDDKHDDAMGDVNTDTDNDLENGSSGTCSGSIGSEDNNSYDDKSFEGSSSSSKSPKVGDDFEASMKLSSSYSQNSLPSDDNVQRKENLPNQCNYSPAPQTNESGELLNDVPTEISSVYESTGPPSSLCIKKSTSISNAPDHRPEHSSVWGCIPAKRNTSMESIDYALEDEVEIQRLEDARAVLQNRITEEAKGNAVLQESLERRKKALHERRLALEQDVTRLQEQLQKQKDLRMTLEAELKMYRGAPLPSSANISEKTKADLEEMALADAEIINLKQKFDELELQLNQQREQNYCYVRDLCNQPLQSPNAHAKLRDKHKDVETTAMSHLLERSTGSKGNRDNYMDGTDAENERKLEAPTSSNQQPPQNQQLDMVHDSNPKSAGVTTSSSVSEPVVARPPAMSNSKKSGGRSEGTNSTTSALSKLTTRLNFLKERRTQIATELQNMDKGRGSGQSTQSSEKGRGSESRPSPQNTDRCLLLGENRHNQNSERSSGVDGGLNKGIGAEVHPAQTQEKTKKSETQSVKSSERGRKLDAQSVRNLERGRSDGQQALNADKGRASDSQISVPPRTNSR